MALIVCCRRRLDRLEDLSRVLKRGDPRHEIGSATYIVSDSHRDAMIPHCADRPCITEARTVSSMVLVPGTPKIYDPMGRRVSLH